jgi:hypothetical protein
MTCGDTVAATSATSPSDSSCPATFQASTRSAPSSAGGTASAAYARGGSASRGSPQGSATSTTTATIAMVVRTAWRVTSAEASSSTPIAPSTARVGSGHAMNCANPIR